MSLWHRSPAILGGCYLDRRLSSRPKWGKTNVQRRPHVGCLRWFAGKLQCGAGHPAAATRGRDQMRRIQPEPLDPILRLTGVLGVDRLGRFDLGERLPKHSIECGMGGHRSEAVIGGGEDQRRMSTAADAPAPVP